MSDIKFTRDGRYILARDYMTLKLWDINMESKPVATYPVHESLRSQVTLRIVASLVGHHMLRAVNCYGCGHLQSAVRALPSLL